MYYNNYTSYHKDKCFSIWTIDMMTTEELMLQCVWGHKYESKHYLLLVKKLKNCKIFYLVLYEIKKMPLPKWTHQHTMKDE